MARRGRFIKFQPVPKDTSDKDLQGTSDSSGNWTPRMKFVPTKTQRRPKGGLTQYGYEKDTWGGGFDSSKAITKAWKKKAGDK